MDQNFLLTDENLQDFIERIRLQAESSETIKLQCILQNTLIKLIMLYPVLKIQVDQIQSSISQIDLIKLTNTINELIQVNPKDIDIGSVNEKTNTTALMFACYEKLPESIILNLIVSNRSNPGQISKNGLITLMIACSKRLSENIITRIIDTGKSNPGFANPNNYTSLMVACRNSLSENIILKILDSGESNPGIVSNIIFNKSGSKYKSGGDSTALILACKKSLSENIILGIISELEKCETGFSSIEYITSRCGYTALLWACKNSLSSSIILGIINTGYANVLHADIYGNTAFTLAIENSLSHDILRALIL